MSLISKSVATAPNMYLDAFVAALAYPLSVIVATVTVSDEPV